jgi:hypothetical protein
MLASGHKALVRHTEESGHTLVTAVEDWPRDIAPLLILDASARVKYSYDLWEMHRGTLRRLKSPQKRYTGLFIHHWKKGGSRTSVQANPEQFVEAMSTVISQALNSSSSCKWLVVTRKWKPGDRTDVWEKLKARLPSKHINRVSHLTWGKHTATNYYAGCTHAMLLGGLYLEREVSESQCLAASGLDVETYLSEIQEVPFGSPYVDVIFQSIGEVHHDLLQAASRIGIRKGAQVAKDHHVYLISATPNDLSDYLQSVFPGCTVVDWRPFGEELSPRQKQLVDYVIEKLPPGSNAFLWFKDIRQELGINEASQLTKLRGEPAVVRALETEGIIEDVSVRKTAREEDRGPQRNTRYRRRQKVEEP